MPANPLTHPSADALRAFALGKLNDSSAAALMSHLDSCADCCKQVAALSGDDFLKRLRQARGNSFTPAPAKAMSETAAGAKRSANQPAIANLPPELAASQQYEILRELGRGGMGVVYLAKNKLMDRLEVLKVVNKMLLDHPGAVERFLREIRSAAKLSHANVVGAYSALQMGELLAFAMEYVEGQDLASLVKSQGALPIQHACYYTQQAALGLQHAFEKGMVHRDIKPQNLILAREGKKHIVKVLDFGLAKLMREKSDDTGLTGEGKMLGTPDYIAPEQTMDAAKADIRADIYSLGCTLYYLLSGHPPFSASSLGAILVAHQMHDARPLNLERPDVPEELAAVVRKMMTKSPAKRYQTPLEVVQALAPFVKQGAAARPAPELSTSTSQVKPAIKVAAPVAPPPAPAPEAPKPPPEPAAVWESLTENSAASIISKKSGATRSPRAATVRERTPQKKLLLGGGIGVGVLLLALLGMWASGVFKVKVKTTEGEAFIVLEVDQSDAEVLVDGEKITLNVPAENKPIEIKVEPGQHKLRISKDGFVAVTKEIELMSGKSPPIKVKLIPVAVAEAKNEPSTYVNSLGMKFKHIPAGKFVMGSKPSEIQRCINLKLPWPGPEQFASEGPEHEVEITKPFYMGIHEVTVGQFRQFVKAMDYKTQAEKEGGAFRHFPDRAQLNRDGTTNWRNPGFEQTDDHPVVCVSWHDAVAFCGWLSGKEGRKYRLPSEAEWEYCCRAKTTTRFCCGDDETRLQEFANIQDASFKQKWPRYPWPSVAWDDGYPFTAPVGQFKANSFGLHDIHGNAYEWCADWYDKEYYKNSPKQDPPGPLKPSAGNYRVARGGSCLNLLTHSRSTFRSDFEPGSAAWFLGFRVVMLPEKREAKAEAPPPKQSPTATNSHPVDVPSPTTPRNDYDDLAKGHWVAVLPSIEEFNRLRAEKAYNGPEPKFAGGVLECNGVFRLYFPAIKSKDVIVRASMKRLGTKNVGNACLGFRTASNEFMSVWFNGGGAFGIGRWRNRSWKDLTWVELSEQHDDFFELAFAVVGNRLIAYANGKKILESVDDAPLDRPVVAVIGTSGNPGTCSALFRNVEVQVLEKLVAEANGPPQDTGFVPLFNGKDLTGWKVFGGGTGNWKVVDGAIVGSGPVSHLFSESGDYENFHYRAEAMINDGGNSGQYFRTEFGPGFPKGYEAQINSTHRDPKKTGSLYGIVDNARQLHMPNEWFTQEVIAIDDHIVIKVKDRTVVDTHDSRYKKGHFALQQHDAATVVKFRKIEVKELSHDEFQSGTVWRGTARQVWEGDPKALVYPVILKVLERDGTSFKARMEIDNQRLIRECNGTIEEGVIKWHGKDEKLIKGPKVGLEYTGRIAADSIELRFAGFDEVIKKQADGVVLFQLEQAASKTARKILPPSVVGTWRGTFQDGNTGDFPFRRDHTVTGTNGFVGLWIQKGRKITVLQTTPSRAPRWEGEIDPSGKTMQLRNDLAGVANYVRQ